MRCVRGNACLPAEVGVDSSKDLSVVCLDVLDNDRAGDGVLAVTAGTVQLAKVHDGEAVDSDSALSVVLNDLVGSRLSSSTLDEGVSISLEGKSILADIDPPDVFDGATALAVNTLDLVLTNDGILEGTSILDDEDCIGVSTLGLTSARLATAVCLHATIKGTRDRLRSLKGNGSLGSGNGKRCTLVQADEASRSIGSRASSDRGHKGGDGSSDGDGELHVGGYCFETLIAGRRRLGKVYMERKIESVERTKCFKRTKD